MSSHHNDDAAINAMSPRQITDVLIGLLEHAESNGLPGLEANLVKTLDALIGEIRDKEDQRALSRANTSSNLVDFGEARRRRSRDAGATAPGHAPDPSDRREPTC